MEIATGASILSIQINHLGYIDFGLEIAPSASIFWVEPYWVHRFWNGNYSVHRFFGLNRIGCIDFGMEIAPSASIFWVEPYWVHRFWNGNCP